MKKVDYDTLNDYKKLLYLLDQVDAIGAKLDFEFTTRNPNLKMQKIIEAERKEGYNEPDRPQVMAGITQEFILTKTQKYNVLDRIDSSMWWFKALKGTVESLK